MSTEAPFADSPSKAQDPDELLSAMADQEVHRMLAAVESGEAPATTESQSSAATQSDLSPSVSDSIPSPVEPEEAGVAAIERPITEVIQPPTPSVTPTAPETILETPLQASAAVTPTDAAHADRSDASPSVPMWLRPLVWINAPLNNQSDTTRNAIGWAAILTLANALGMLGYAYLKRR